MKTKAPPERAWSIKLDPALRVPAKQSALGAGMTLAEWIEMVIRKAAGKGGKR